MRFGPVLVAPSAASSRAAAPARSTRTAPIAAVSPSTRQELRRRLGFRGPIHIVPNGNTATPDAAGPARPGPDDHGGLAAGAAQARRPAAGPARGGRGRRCRSCASTSSATARSGCRLTALAAELGLRRRRHLPRLPARRGPRRAAAPGLADHEHLAPRGLGPVDHRGGRVRRADARAAACRACATRWSTAAPAGSSTRSAQLRHGGDPARCASSPTRTGPARSPRRARSGRGASPGTAAPSLLAGRAARRGQAGGRPGRPLGPQRHGHHRGVRPAA